MRDAFRSLAAKGAQWLAGQGLDVERTHGVWSLDLRYLGQSFELTVPVSADEVADESGEALRRRFHASYLQVVDGFTDETADLEVLNLRATAIGVTRRGAASPRATRLPGWPLACRARGRPRRARPRGLARGPGHHRAVRHDRSGPARLHRDPGPERQPDRRGDRMTTDKV